MLTKVLNIPEIQKLFNQDYSKIRAMIFLERDKKGKKEIEIEEMIIESSRLDVKA